MAALARALSAMLPRCCVVLLLLYAAPAAAQDDVAAQQIKAAFLHKFATYVQGAGTAFGDPSVPLVYGIAGSEEVYDFLADIVATQGAGVQPADVRRVDASDDLAGVHVLYVGPDAAIDPHELLEQGVQRSMLTVSDLPGPQPANSMIHFFVADDRVRFDIALAPAAEAGLRLSSRLLQVARVVED
ncbi:MAG: YfiR family protein [Gammaproteobacteria bacterium]